MHINNQLKRKVNGYLCTLTKHSPQYIQKSFHKCQKAKKTHQAQCKHKYQHPLFTASCSPPGCLEVLTFTSHLPYISLLIPGYPPGSMRVKIKRINRAHYKHHPTPSSTIFHSVHISATPQSLHVSLIFHSQTRVICRSPMPRELIEKRYRRRRLMAAGKEGVARGDELID